jgi:hypothetical protein
VGVSSVGSLPSQLRRLQGQRRNLAVETCKVTIYFVQPPLNACVVVEAPKSTVYSVQSTSHVNIREDHSLDLFGLLIVLTHGLFFR